MIDRFLLLVGLLGEAPALLRGRIQLGVQSTLAYNSALLITVVKWFVVWASEA